MTTELMRAVTVVTSIHSFKHSEKRARMLKMGSQFVIEISGLHK